MPLENCQNLIESTIANFVWRVSGAPQEVQFKNCMELLDLAKKAKEELEKTSFDQTLTRLSTWTYKHKSRCVEISIDNGYGATCWVVKLWHEHGRTVAEECFFMVHSDADGGIVKTRQVAKEQGLVTPDDQDEEDWDWPGVVKTINAALDAFDAGIWMSLDKLKQENRLNK